MRKMKQTKTLYSFSNWQNELLNLYQKNSEAKKIDLCAVIFYPCSVHSSSNIKTVYFPASPLVANSPHQ